MSLHCPATLLVVTADVAARLAPEALHRERIAAVHVAPQPVCEAAALALGARLGVPTDRGADVGSSDPARSRTALETVADLHRGETVLVVAPPTLLDQLPHLAFDQRGATPGCGAAVLECGDDGWALLPTPPLAG